MSEENLRIVLGHLADNARHHGATRLQVEARAGADAMQIRITDDGSGISSNNRPRIFDNFFTTRREQGGTGMGLSIVRAMLGAHGGEIVLVESNQGATFLLTMPLATTA